MRRSLGAVDKVAYQSRKKSKTSNMLFITDKNGIILSFSEVEEGKHHDIFDIKKQFEKLIETFLLIGIPLRGLILNADAGFDGKALREIAAKYEIEVNIKLNPRNGKVWDREEYFDEDFSKHRFVIERTFAWMDAFKALLIRYEKIAVNWLNFNILGLIKRTIIKKYKS